MDFAPIVDHQVVNASLSDKMFSIMAPAALFGSLLLSFLATANTSTPNVSLYGYGIFSGTNVTTTLKGDELPIGVDAWLGIDYAEQPVGNRRFRPLQSQPASFNGVRNATKYSSICLQDLKYPYPDEQDEACLNFNVYRTPGIPLGRKLPTLVWIHGGGFASFSARDFDGASFVASSASPVVVVTFNYRLNALGFLPSKLFERQGLLNLGLQDQHFFLKFLQQHLSSFGGDPRQITLGGLSAGAHSAGFHYFHNYGVDKNKPLFARAFLQSGSATARSFPGVDYPRYKEDFAGLMDHTGCSLDGGDDAQVDCLRGASAEKIREYAGKAYEDAKDQLNWPWQPSIGGPLLEKAGSQSGSDSTFHHLPILTTYTSDEGKYYTPGNLETNDDFIQFMHRISPALNITDLALINELYPDPSTNPDSPWAGSPNSTQYNRISAAWSDMSYICPSRQTAMTTSRAGVPTWRLHFNTPGFPLETQSWRGIPHASDSAYAWNDPQVAYPETARIYYGYINSFVLTGNPNTLRLDGTVEWSEYKDSDGYAKQLLVNPGNFTVVEKDSSRSRQCKFWNDIERAGRLYK
ncbi:Alpha/Beta hydrolase protein [Fusarium avenaceum]|nr:Alpha/Beta hydrolase protein [Fusarium avenaceum]